MRDGKWDYTIKAYRPTNQGGGLLMETVHRGRASRDIELEAFLSRQRRGEVGAIQAIAHSEPYGVEWY